MEELRVTGIVITAENRGENDKLLCLLTKEAGRIYVSAKGARSSKNKHFISAQLFCVSEFVLHRRNDFWYISDTSKMENFFPLRRALDKVALATYFTEVVSSVSAEGTENADLFSLLLNCLYVLAYRENYPLAQVKAVFELRCAMTEGLTPAVGCCDLCGVTENVPFFLDVMNGRLLCDRCRQICLHTPKLLDDGVATVHIPLSDSVLNAVRYIVRADSKRIFSFQLDRESLALLVPVCEKYLLHQLGHGYISLDFYKSL